MKKRTVDLVFADGRTRGPFEFRQSKPIIGDVDEVGNARRSVSPGYSSGRLLALTVGAIMALTAVWMAIGAHNAQAQTSGLAVVILRPGEGESLYSDRSTPFAAVPVTGRVWVNGFDLNQLQARLDVLQGTRVSQSAALKLEKDGTFRIDVGINPNSLTDLTEDEHGCDGRCHMGQSVILPGGPVLLRVTVGDALGHQAVAQRSVFIDYATDVDLPVQVTVEGGMGNALAGLKIIADARLYLWRTREIFAVTDASGHATLHLDRSVQVPTHYVLQVETGTVNGMRITGRAPVTVTIPAGATSLAPVTLRAQAQRGQIAGSLDAAGLANLPSLTIRAVDLTSGLVRTVPVAKGKFGLTDLPLGNYLLTIDDTQAATLMVQADPQTVDLRASPFATVTLKVAATAAQSVVGIIHDSNGSPLPFAWIANDKQTKVGRAGPGSGEFVQIGLAGERVLWVTAPGYWSRPVAVADRLDIALNPLPDTRSVPWGSGSIVLPAQTLADVSGNRISLTRGWLWGKGSGALTIRTRDLDVTLQGGAFSLEYLPGEINGLYLREGQAQVTTGDNETFAVNAEQMVVFGKGVTAPIPVPLDSAAVRALHMGQTSQVSIETDGSPIALMTDQIEGLGISSSLVVLAAGLAVVILALSRAWMIRKRRVQTP